MMAFLAFAAGYVAGARAGGEDFSDVVRSFEAIRKSEEFNDLVTAVRSHTGQALRRLATVVEEGEPTGFDTHDLVARVRHLAGRE